VDIRLSGSSESLLSDLQGAGRIDLGDFLTFVVEPDRDHPTIEGDGMIYGGLRFRVQAMLAGKAFAGRFGLGKTLFPEQPRVRLPFGRRPDREPDGVNELVGERRFVRAKGSRESVEDDVAGRWVDVRILARATLSRQAHAEVPLADTRRAEELDELRACSFSTLERALRICLDCHAILPHHVEVRPRELLIPGRSDGCDGDDLGPAGRRRCGLGAGNEEPCKSEDGRDAAHGGRRGPCVG